MDGSNTRIFEQKNLTFIVTEKRIVVQTRLQCFYLEPKAPYWKRRLNLIRLMIQLDKIEDLNQLAEFCGPGVAWVITLQKYNKELMETV
jgi:hypothetical protein